ncbi:MAG: S-layer homology domain-containing protein [Sedimentibacter sp.]
MKLINKLFKLILRTFVIVLIGGAVTASLMEFTFSATTENNPNVLVTINGDGSITQVGNLFDGQLYPSTVSDAENGIGGISGVIRIQNQFRKIDVDNLAIGIKDMDIGNEYPRDTVFNSFLNKVRLKIEKGTLFSFDKTLIEYTSLKNILYEADKNEYRGYTLDKNDKFSLSKGDTIDLKYSLHMELEAGNELQKITAYMPIYINLKESHIDDDEDDGDDDSEIVTIEDSEIPVAELNKEDHFQYIQGYPDNKVRPEGLITREEVSAVFYRLLEAGYRSSILTEEEDFNDVDDGRWSIKHIATLSNGNIVDGYPDGSFKPGNSITRAELAVIASKFDKLSALAGNSFSDIEDHWAIEYINSAAEKGWVKGYPDGTFKPDQYITRAEFVTLVNNVLGRGIHKENILKEVRVFPDLLDAMWYYEAMQEAINSHLYIRNEDMTELWIEIIYPKLDL